MQPQQGLSVAGHLVVQLESVGSRQPFARAPAEEYAGGTRSKTSLVRSLDVVGASSQARSCNGRFADRRQNMLSTLAGLFHPSSQVGHFAAEASQSELTDRRTHSVLVLGCRSHITYQDYGSCFGDG